MRLSKVVIGNFKGVRETVGLKLRPVTVFVGPNSSGKSTCLHALACLAQSVKLTGGKSPLQLGDEHSYVRLGRFTDVIHDKGFSSDIQLGVSYEGFETRLTVEKNAQLLPQHIEATFNFKFKPVKEQISLNKVILRQDDTQYNISSIGETSTLYNAKIELSRKSSKMIRADGFSFLPDFNNMEQVLKMGPAAMPVWDVSSAISADLKKIKYLGPFRQSPKRRYHTGTSEPTEVGAEGENAVLMLANDQAQTKTRAHVKRVSQWLSDLGLGRQVLLSKVGRSEIRDFHVQLPDGANLPLADLGFGLSQVLPVLVQCSFAQEGDVLLFEQPELHLHHGAAKCLAKIFTEIASSGVTVICETHSESFFWGFAEEFRSGRLKVDEFVAYDVKRTDGKSVFTEIPVEMDEGDFHAFGYNWQQNLL